MCRDESGWLRDQTDPVRFHEAHHQAVVALNGFLEGTIVESSKEFWSNFERGYLAHLGVPEADLDHAV